MPRVARGAEAGLIYHVLNRGNDRKQIFFKPRDYLAFLNLLAEGLAHAQVQLLAFCLMPNHWHLILRPLGPKELAKYMAWVTNTHAKRYREHYHTTGHGHVYQGRYKSFVTQEDSHLLVVMRYVEGNALRAGLVTRAEQWPWSSVAVAGLPGAVRHALSPWPIDRPADWLEIVNEIPAKQELEELRISLKRERPFGSTNWVAATAARLGLTSTLRARGGQRREGPLLSNLSLDRDLQ